MYIYIYPTIPFEWEYIYIYIYIYICVCVCVCVRERERERDRVPTIPSEWGNIYIYIYVCVCVCMCVCVCFPTIPSEWEGFVKRSIFRGFFSESNLELTFSYMSCRKNKIANSSILSTHNWEKNCPGFVLTSLWSFLTTTNFRPRVPSDKNDR